MEVTDIHQNLNFQENEVAFVFDGHMTFWRKHSKYWNDYGRNVQFNSLKMHKIGVDFLIFEW